MNLAHSPTKEILHVPTGCTSLDGRGNREHNEVSSLTDSAPVVGATVVAIL